MKKWDVGYLSALGWAVFLCCLAVQCWKECSTFRFVMRVKSEGAAAANVGHWSRNRVDSLSRMPSVFTLNLAANVSGHVIVLILFQVCHLCSVWRGHVANVSDHVIVWILPWIRHRYTFRVTASADVRACMMTSSLVTRQTRQGYSHGGTALLVLFGTYNTHGTVIDAIRILLHCLKDTL